MQVLGDLHVHSHGLRVAFCDQLDLAPESRSQPQVETSAAIAVAE